MKLLKLTSLRKVLNEEAERKLEEFRNLPDNEEPTDSEGRTRSWYEDMNIKNIPQEIIDKERQLENGLELDLEKDYDYFEVNIMINMSEFEMCEDDTEDGCIIHLKSGKYLEVLEDCADINAQIWYQNRSNWEKIKEWIAIKRIQIKNKWNK